jgi:cyclophilin family peptidyl-prolyl cis-trans isomerase
MARNNNSKVPLIAGGVFVLLVVLYVTGGGGGGGGGGEEHGHVEHHHAAEEERHVEKHADADADADAGDGQKAKHEAEEAERERDAHAHDGDEKVGRILIDADEPARIAKEALDKAKLADGRAARAAGLVDEDAADDGHPKKAAKAKEEHAADDAAHADADGHPKKAAKAKEDHAADDAHAEEDVGAEGERRKGDQRRAHAASDDEEAGGESHCVLHTALGAITFRMRPDGAPKTVANFQKLARTGFFNGTTLYRYEPNFCLQGGGWPKKSSPLKAVPLEYKLPNVKFAVSMARTAEPDSATCEFSIMLNDNSKWLGPGGSEKYGYAVFAEVAAGFGVIRNIGKQPTHKAGLTLLTTPVVIKYVEVVKGPVPRHDEEQ